MSLPFKKTLLIAVAVLILVSGVGYARWKYFVGILSEEELKDYTPLSFEAKDGIGRCAVEASSWDNLFVTRYFIIKKKLEFRRIAELLGYRRVYIKGFESYDDIDFKKYVILGTLQAIPEEHGWVETAHIEFKRVLRKDKNIVVEVKITREWRPIYTLDEPDKEPIRNCAYSWVEISKSELILGMNNFYFIDEAGNILKREKLLIL